MGPNSWAQVNPIYLCPPEPGYTDAIYEHCDNMLEEAVSFEQPCEVAGCGSPSCSNNTFSEASAIYEQLGHSFSSDQYAPPAMPLLADYVTF